MLASFHLIPGGKLNILQAAAEVSSESSTGTNFLVQTETPYARLLNALVYEIDMKDSVVKIAYPRRLFDR
jgi:ribulose-bisphosphate carboxylase large chain